ncbi:MAG: carboxylate-amine ligase [Solirubrobacteraceae bacterium]
METPSPTADELRAAFDAPHPMTIGLEEELFLLDPETLDLAPRATEALAATNSDPRFKLELPAAQLEITVPPLATVPEALDQLRGARRDLAEATAGLVAPVAIAVHPFAAGEGELNRGARYDRTAREHGVVARRQLVCALQVHVAVAGADRTLAVYNALRSHLPELAALAAAAPFHEGRDTGLASIRPIVAGQLPRQGMPPHIASWDAWADDLRWGAASGTVPEPRVWWWELRPHPTFGTLEVRVPDAQPSAAGAGAVAAVIHALIAHLAARHDAGEPLPARPTWRLAENRWLACRHGVEGELADPDTGRRVATRARLHALLDAIEEDAASVGCGAQLAHARGLVEHNGAMVLRDVARERGVEGVAEWLVERFTADGEG